MAVLGQSPPSTTARPRQRTVSFAGASPPAFAAPGSNGAAVFILGESHTPAAGAQQTASPADTRRRTQHTPSTLQPPPRQTFDLDEAPIAPVNGSQPLFVVVEDHVGAGAADALARVACELEFPAGQAEFAELAREVVGGHAEIDHRAEVHVAGDAGGAIVVEDAFRHFWGRRGARG